MELGQYINVFRRWALFLILGLVLGGGGGYLGSKYQTPIYSATSKLMVGGSLQGSSQPDISSYNAQQLALTYVQMITTRPFLDSVSERLGYPVSLENVSAQLVSNTQIIQVKIEDTNPTHAQNVANMLVTVLIERNETLQAGRFSTNEANLVTQIDQVQKQIATLQGDISKISEQNIQNQLEQVKVQIAPLQDEVTKLQQEIALLDVKYPTSEQKAQKVEKQSRLAQIQPLLIQYQQVYNNLLILGQAGTTSQKNNIQLTQLQSTLNVYQQLYINLLSSLEAVRLSRMQSTPTVTQIEPAILPVNPVRPNLINNTLIAAALGFLLAASVVLLVEYLDDTVKTPEQVERLFGLSVLGYIADVPGAKGQQRALYVSTQPRSPVAEAFRSLRTNLEFSGIDHPLRTLLITSSGPEEGKTTVSTNLATIIAQSGKHVALLDVDMRRPSVHRFFDIPNRVGLTDVFRGKMTLDAVGNSWNGTGKISVYTSGSLPPNPSEMLGSEKMRLILEDLKQSNDLVILDSPPSIVADAQVLSTKVDGVIVVIWPGHTHLSGLRATITQLNRVDAHVLGFVFNRIPQNRRSYYGDYKYYSLYHYPDYQAHSSDNSDPATILTKDS